MAHLKRMVHFLIIFILGSYSSNGQGVYGDTLKMTIREADSIFIARNLQLLAQKYNVSATKAMIIQARLYPNPEINFEQGAYNPQTKKWFE